MLLHACTNAAGGLSHSLLGKSEANGLLQTNRAWSCCHGGTFRAKVSQFTPYKQVYFGDPFLFDWDMNCFLCIPTPKCCTLQTVFDLNRQLETTVYLFQMNLPKGLKPELSLSLLLEAWESEPESLAGRGKARRVRRQQGSWIQSGHSARDSASKYNTAVDICIRHKWPLIEAYTTCYILLKPAIWENSILFLICRKSGVGKWVKSC